MKMYVALFALFFSVSAHSAAPSLRNLTTAELDSVIKDLSALNTPHFVMPPSKLGSIFGFEFGLLAGISSSKNIESVSKQVDSTISLPYLPHVGLLGALATPIGLEIDFLVLPSVGSEVKLSQTAFGLKYNLDFFPGINLAARGFWSSSKLTFNQTVRDTTLNQDVIATVDYSTTIMGAQALIGPDLPIFEPYFGLGYASAKGDLSLTGATFNVFNFTTTQSASSSPTTTQIILGFNAKLALLVLGAEWMRSFDADTYSAKLSLRF